MPCLLFRARELLEVPNPCLIMVLICVFFLKKMQKSLAWLSICLFVCIKKIGKGAKNCSGNILAFLGGGEGYTGATCVSL